MSLKQTASGAPGTGRQPVRVRGRLKQALVRKGTASEHQAWVLAGTSHGELLLKRLNANPFELGPAPGASGDEVEAEGYVLGDELRYTMLRRL